MKYLFFFLLTVCALGAFSFTTVGSDSKIQWATSYEEALKESRITSKPIVLFFTGSDWCTWCNKLEQEALCTTEFASSAGNKFIFVKVDFPMNKTLDPITVEQNQRLQNKYQVRGYPTLILVDQNEKTIGTTGYKAGGGVKFAAHISNIADQYTATR